MATVWDQLQRAKLVPNFTRAASLQQFAINVVMSLVHTQHSFVHKSPSEIRADWKLVAKNCKQLVKLLKGLGGLSHTGPSIANLMHAALRTGSNHPQVDTLLSSLRWSASNLSLSTQIDDLTVVLHQLEDQARAAAKRNPPEGFSKRKGATGDKNFVLRQLVQYVHSAYRDPLNKVIATTVDVAVRNSKTNEAEVRQLRKKLGL